MALLEVNDLHTSFFTDAGEVKAVDGVSFRLDHGKVLGIVGESGCGKSVTSLSILRLIPSPPGKIIDGEIIYHGQDLVKKSEREMRSIRGNDISMIFQEPMTSLNPVFTVGQQIGESFRFHQQMGKAEMLKKSIEMLRLVGIPEPEKRVRQYPHEFSGGMRQRAALIRTLAMEPDLLLLDEPFSALDSLTRISMQDWLIGQVKGLDATVMMVTHDVEEAMLVGNKIFLLSGRPVKQIKVIDVSHITCREDLYTPSSVELKNELVRAFLTEKAERGDNI